MNIERKTQYELWINGKEQKGELKRALHVKEKVKSTENRLVLGIFELHEEKAWIE